MALSGRIHVDGACHGRLRTGGGGLTGGGPRGTALAVGVVKYIKCGGGCLTGGCLAGMALSVAAAPGVVATQLLGALLFQMSCIARVA